MNSYSLQWLISRVSENLTPGQAEKFSEFAPKFFETIIEGVRTDGTVVINGFGIFTLENGNISFMPDSVFADAVNLPFAYFEPIPLNDESLVDSLNLLDKNDSAQPVNAAADQQVKPDFSDNEIKQGQTVEAEDKHTVPEALPETPTDEKKTDVEQQNTDGDADSKQCDANDENDTFITTAHQETHSGSMHIFWIILIFLFGAGIGYVIGSNYPYYERWSENQEVVEDETETDTTEDISSDMTNTEDTLKQQIEPEPAPEKEETATLPQETAKKETEIVYDTISRNKFLSRIARKHYGSSEFWSYIYLENADRLGNPDRIPEGTVLVIPPAEKYGINASDAASVSRAKNEQARIYQKFKK